jgi:lysophospholipase L1-like esterase
MLSLARRTVGTLVLGLLFVTPTLVFGQQPDPDPARFTEAMTRFEQWDTQNAFPERGIVFVGSSSIVRWASANDFPGLPIINRGFGGSHISDVNHYIEQTVLKYAPDIVVFYAGNNDINVGKPPQQVFEDYQEFTAAVHARKPETHILHISSHPSMARWYRWTEIQASNTLIREYSERNPRLHYVDIAPGMLGSDGRPMPHLFVDDGLHLSPAGYAVWTPIVARAIAGVRPATASRE